MAKIKIEDLEPNQTDQKVAGKRFSSSVRQALEEKRRSRIRQTTSAQDFLEKKSTPNPS